ncbi:MAG: hypothetical protein ACFN2Z_01225, partial [Oribacterium sp.]
MFGAGNEKLRRKNLPSAQRCDIRGKTIAFQKVYDEREEQYEKKRKRRFAALAAFGSASFCSRGGLRENGAKELYG